MQPQPVHGADAYSLRMILHDWSDEDAVRILKKLVVAMRDSGGSEAASSLRLLVMDLVPVAEERIMRARDLTMLQAFNSKEMELENWKQVISATDAELRLVNVAQPFRSVSRPWKLCRAM